MNEYSLKNLLVGQGGTFVGWGRKRSGLLAVFFAKLFQKEFLLFEDGFIRSKGLGTEGHASYSLVKDDLGIYYDASKPSRLEALIQNYDFTSDFALVDRARQNIRKIVSCSLSKYNDGRSFSDSELLSSITEAKVLIVAQTAGDASLKYGKADAFSTQDLIRAAINENPGSKIYLKLHPDTFHGKKQSDINVKDLPESIVCITDNIKPLELLKYFDAVYTKTSQMGFEALLLQKRVVCFGLPFYAGWGLTDDRVKCERRTQKRTVEEVFAAAYLLYSIYADPESCRQMTLEEVVGRLCNKD